MLETLIKIRREDSGQTQGGRDVLAEAAMDVRGYSADPYSRQRLAENRREGVPVKQGPKVLRVEIDSEGRFWANERFYGPFDSEEAMDVAVYGSRRLWI
jgi:hypothetical protein